jgi:hypothetical protein
MLQQYFACFFNARRVFAGAWRPMNASLPELLSPATSPRQAAAR